MLGENRASSVSEWASVGEHATSVSAAYQLSNGSLLFSIYSMVVTTGVHQQVELSLWP